MSATGYESSHVSDPGKQARSRAGIPVAPVFDGYRAYAILGVVLLHLVILSGVVSTGDNGALAFVVRGTIGHAIDVLFVVSGFVVFLQTVSRQATSAGSAPTRSGVRRDCCPHTGQ